MHQFDELSKTLALGLTRRGALRQLGGGLAGALLASVGLRTARGAPPVTNCAGYCRSLGFTPGNGNAYGNCVSNCSNCVQGGGQACGGAGCCAGTPTSYCCSGTCTDLTSDPNNCGGCGQVC